MARHRVARESEIAAVGALKRVVVDTTPICLVRASDGRVYAVSDTCTHEGQALSDGELWGMEIECPRHVSRFDVRTGEVTGPPALLPVETFPVVTEEGHIVVDL
jgi:3-phenylpropionate/trans-cinnamate dioxygenase ferredoxin component